MNCSFAEKVSAFIDGELTGVELRELERHLVSCPECQEVRADFLQLRRQVSEFESTVRPSVQRAALAKILTPSGRHDLPRRFSWKWGYGAAALATIVFVALVLGVFSYQKSNNTPDSNATAQASPSPVPAAPVEQNKQHSSDDSTESPKEKKSEAPRKESKPPVKRTAPPREPKPGEQFASLPQRVRAVDPQMMTAVHFEKSEHLLRAFRNLRLGESGSSVNIGYERKRAQQLVYQNMMLRREADSDGDVQSSSLLESLEPILLDIANLPDKANNDKVKVINERVERKNIVALLQVNSAVLARALDD